MNSISNTNHKSMFDEKGSEDPYHFFCASNNEALNTTDFKDGTILPPPPYPSSLLPLNTRWGIGDEELFMREEERKGSLLETTHMEDGEVKVKEESRYPAVETTEDSKFGKEEGGEERNRSDWRGYEKKSSIRGYAPYLRELHFAASSCPPYYFSNDLRSQLHMECFLSREAPFKSFDIWAKGIDRRDPVHGELQQRFGKHALNILFNGEDPQKQFAHLAAISKIACITANLPKWRQTYEQDLVRTTSSGARRKRGAFTEEIKAPLFPRKLQRAEDEMRSKSELPTSAFYANTRNLPLALNLDGSESTRRDTKRRKRISAKAPVSHETVSVEPVAESRGGTLMDNNTTRKGAHQDDASEERIASKRSDDAAQKRAVSIPFIERVKEMMDGSIRIDAFNRAIQALSPQEQRTMCVLLESPALVPREPVFTEEDFQNAMRAPEPSSMLGDGSARDDEEAARREEANNRLALENEIFMRFGNMKKGEDRNQDPFVASAARILDYRKTLPELASLLRNATVWAQNNARKRAEVRVISENAEIREGREIIVEYGCSRVDQFLVEAENAEEACCFHIMGICRGMCDPDLIDMWLSGKHIAGEEDTGSSKNPAVYSGTRNPGESKGVPLMEGGFALRGWLTQDELDDWNAGRAIPQRPRICILCHRWIVQFGVVHAENRDPDRVLFEHFNLVGVPGGYVAGACHQTFSKAKGQLGYFRVYDAGTALRPALKRSRDGTRVLRGYEEIAQVKFQAGLPHSVVCNTAQPAHKTHAYQCTLARQAWPFRTEELIADTLRSERARVSPFIDTDHAAFHSMPWIRPVPPRVWKLSSLYCTFLTPYFHEQKQPTYLVFAPFHITLWYLGILTAPKICAMEWDDRISFLTMQADRSVLPYSNDLSKLLSDLKAAEVWLQSQSPDTLAFHFGDASTILLPCVSLLILSDSSSASSASSASSTLSSLTAIAPSRSIDGDANENAGAENRRRKMGCWQTEWNARTLFSQVNTQRRGEHEPATVRTTPLDVAIAKFAHAISLLIKEWKPHATEHLPLTQKLCEFVIAHIPFIGFHLSCMKSEIDPEAEARASASKYLEPWRRALPLLASGSVARKIHPRCRLVVAGDEAYVASSASSIWQCRVSRRTPSESLRARTALPDLTFPIPTTNDLLFGDFCDTLKWAVAHLSVGKATKPGAVSLQDAFQRAFWFQDLFPAAHRYDTVSKLREEGGFIAYTLLARTCAADEVLKETGSFDACMVRDSHLDLLLEMVEHGTYRDELLVKKLSRLYPYDTRSLHAGDLSDNTQAYNHVRFFGDPKVKADNKMTWHHIKFKLAPRICSGRQFIDMLLAQCQRSHYALLIARELEIGLRGLFPPTDRMRSRRHLSVAASLQVRAFFRRLAAHAPQDASFEANLETGDITAFESAEPASTETLDSTGNAAIPNRPSAPMLCFLDWMKDNAGTCKAMLYECMLYHLSKNRALSVLLEAVYPDWASHADMAGNNALRAEFDACCQNAHYTRNDAAFVLSVQSGIFDASPPVASKAPSSSAKASSRKSRNNERRRGETKLAPQHPDYASSALSSLTQKLKRMALVNHHGNGDIHGSEKNANHFSSAAANVSPAIVPKSAEAWNNRGGGSYLIPSHSYTGVPEGYRYKKEFISFLVNEMRMVATRISSSAFLPGSIDGNEVEQRVIEAVVRRLPRRFYWGCVLRALRFSAATIRTIAEIAVLYVTKRKINENTKSLLVTLEIRDFTRLLRFLQAVLTYQEVHETRFVHKPLLVMQVRALRRAFIDGLRFDAQQYAPEFFVPPSLHTLMITPLYEMINTRFFAGASLISFGNANEAYRFDTDMFVLSAKQTKTKIKVSSKLNELYARLMSILQEGAPVPTELYSDIFDILKARLKKVQREDHPRVEGVDILGCFFETRCRAEPIRKPKKKSDPDSPLSKAVTRLFHRAQKKTPSASAPRKRKASQPKSRGPAKRRKKENNSSGLGEYPLSIDPQLSLSDETRLYEAVGCSNERRSPFWITPCCGTRDSYEQIRWMPGGVYMCGKTFPERKYLLAHWQRRCAICLRAPINSEALLDIYAKKPNKNRRKNFEVPLEFFARRALHDVAGVCWVHTCARCKQLFDWTEQRIVSVSFARFALKNDTWQSAFNERDSHLTAFKPTAQQEAVRTAHRKVSSGSTLARKHKRYDPEAV